LGKVPNVARGRPISSKPKKQQEKQKTEEK